MFAMEAGMRSFTWLVSIAGLLGISLLNAVEFWNQSSPWRKLLLLIAILATCALAYLDVVSWVRNRTKIYKSEDEINVYMRNLLQRGGSANIFACNLSWVTPNVRAFMIEHARCNKILKLYVPRHNKITRDLASKGVHVITYENLGYTPEARFTLLNPDEPGSSLLAIGKGTVPRFVIEEFTDNEHARMISIARDLFHILDRAAQDERPAN
jgi:hypothetical protein